MGSFVSFQEGGTQYEDPQNVAPELQQRVRDNARHTYLAGIIVWVAIWVAVVWKWGLPSNWMLVGAGIAVALLAVNMWQSNNETVGTYAVEKAEAAQLERNAFSIVVTTFAFGSLLSNLDKSLVYKVLPLLIGTLFCAVVLVFSPIWVSTTDPVPTIEIKHVRTVFSVYALGFVCSALLFVLRNMRQAPVQLAESK